MKIIKLAKFILAPILTCIFNKCINEGFHPDCLQVAEVIHTVAILRGAWVGQAPPRFLLGSLFDSLSFFINFKIVWLAYTGLPNALCKNTGHSVNSARSKLCRNS